MCDLVVVLGFDNIFSGPSVGRSGGLSLFWKKEVYVSNLFWDLFWDVRMLEVEVKSDDLFFYLFCIYGDPNLKHHHVLWKRIERMVTTRQGLWI